MLKINLIITSILIQKLCLSPLEIKQRFMVWWLIDKVIQTRKLYKNQYWNSIKDNQLSKHGFSRKIKLKTHSQQVPFSSL